MHQASLLTDRSDVIKMNAEKSDRFFGSDSLNFTIRTDKCDINLRKVATQDLTLISPSIHSGSLRIKKYSRSSLVPADHLR